MKSTIICLLLGLITVDQVSQVDAIRLDTLKHRVKGKKHRHHGLHRPRWNIQMEYESPFGLDSKHGYGGTDEKKLESKIDLGEMDSDEEIE